MRQITTSLHNASRSALAALAAAIVATGGIGATVSYYSSDSNPSAGPEVAMMKMVDVDACQANDAWGSATYC